MLEFLALLAAIATIIWTRKQDIVSALDGVQYRNHVLNELTEPPNRYRKILSSALKVLDIYLERGPNTYFALLFISLVYNSALFGIAWAFFGDVQFTQNINTSIEDKPWIANLLFIAAVIAIPSCYFLSKQGREIEDSLSSLFSALENKAAREVISRIFITIIVTASIYFHSGHEWFAAAVFFFSILQVFSIGEDCTDDELIGKQHPRRLAISAAFGPTALLAVVFSLIVGRVGGTVEVVIPAVIVFMSTLSGIMAYVGQKISLSPKGRESRRNNSSFPALKEGQKDYLGRAPVQYRMFISMGLHIAHHYSGFALAVSLAAFLPAVMNHFGLEILSSNVAVLLTCAIFMAGARTIAGSGLVIFVVMIFSSSILFFTSKQDFFSTWAVPLLFWAILPIVNSIFDTITWSLSRFFARKIVDNKHSFAAFWIILDIISAYLVIVALVVCVVFALNTYQTYSTAAQGEFPIDLGYLLSVAKEHPFGQGLWIILMLVSTTIPTLAHLFIAASVGISNTRPSFSAKKLHTAVVSLSGDAPQATKESIGWRLAIFDPTTGFFVFLALAVGFAWLSFSSLSAFGHSLLAIATYVLEILH
ncbi:hypothetical protein ACFL12_00790 [Pseudomonadota bacterium]